VHQNAGRHSCTAGRETDFSRGMFPRQRSRENENVGAESECEKNAEHAWCENSQHCSSRKHPPRQMFRSGAVLRGAAR